ncbi:MAG: U32 family peptidase [Candidatus Margulisiibacteriota bacterium]|jgi:collagenase-like PrtC family protease
MKNLIKPELVAPAGNLEKLKIAFQYGADAAYLGTPVFGLRKYSDNFNLTELKIAAQLAKKLHKKIYLVLNGFAHNSDLSDIKTLLEKIKKIDLHGLVISDLGVFNLAKEICDFPIHVSTQISTTNEYAVNFWADAGAKRSILARQLNLKEIAAIRKNTTQELEVFIYGANCAGFAGSCVISNYTAARDANRGGCIQNCRHLFNVYDKQLNFLGSDYFMNTKDLCLINSIPELIKMGINAFKIEGRMKSNLYLASVVSNYRYLIDACFLAIKEKKEIDQTILKKTYLNLKEINNRPFLDETKALKWDNIQKYQKGKFIFLFMPIFAIKIAKIGIRIKKNNHSDRRPIKVPFRGFRGLFKHFKTPNIINIVIASLRSNPQRECPLSESIINSNTNNLSTVSFIGTIKELNPGLGIFIDVKNPFKLGDTLEFVGRNGEIQPFTVKQIINLNNEILDHARINQIVKLPWQDFFFQFGVLRKKRIPNNK